MILQADLRFSMRCTNRTDIMEISTSVFSFMRLCFVQCCGLQLKMKSVLGKKPQMLVPKSTGTRLLIKPQRKRVV